MKTAEMNTNLGKLFVARRLILQLLFLEKALTGPANLGFFFSIVFFVFNYEFIAKRIRFLSDPTFRKHFLGLEVQNYYYS